MQVSKMLKKLGLKVPAKVKVHSSDASNGIRGKKKDLSKGTAHPNSTSTDKSSSLGKPT